MWLMSLKNRGSNLSLKKKVRVNSQLLPGDLTRCVGVELNGNIGLEVRPCYRPQDGLALRGYPLNIAGRLENSGPDVRTFNAFFNLANEQFGELVNRDAG